jgi:hypothetical protein
MAKVSFVIRAALIKKVRELKEMGVIRGGE